MSRKKVGALILCGLGLLGGRPASAQTTGAVPSPSAATPGLPTTTGSTGTASMVAPTGPLNPAAAATGTSAQGGLFSNPLAAPLLYNSMLPGPQTQAQANAYYGPTGLGTTQLGL